MLIIKWLLLPWASTGKYPLGKIKKKGDLFLRSVLRITNIMAVFYQILSLITKKSSGKGV